LHEFGYNPCFLFFSDAKCSGPDYKSGHFALSQKTSGHLLQRKAFSRTFSAVAQVQLEAAAITTQETGKRK